MAGHDRHADTAGDHAPGADGADRGVGYDRLFRGPAWRDRGGRAG